MADYKRPLNDEMALTLAKRNRSDLAIVPQNQGRVLATVVNMPGRTSGLLAPNMLLTGHSHEVFSIKFNPNGNTLASGSFDRNIMIWNTYGECENLMVLRGHRNAVLDLQYTDEFTLVSASADKNIFFWDMQSGERTKKCAGHFLPVNSVCPSRKHTNLVASGSNDATVRLWDQRVKGCVQLYESKYPVTSVSLADSGHQIYSGGLDNSIKVWDVRKGGVEMFLSGHGSTVTGLSLSPDGTHLLSNSADGTVRVWDVRPFAPNNRCVKIFEGVQHNMENNLLRCSWSPDGSRITAGSSDHFLYIWDTVTRRIKYKLPGHSGSINEVVFHPHEPIIASCGSDRQIYLGELPE
eukprot:TRINITY_DN3974_c0_g2_i1.p1 TRINITY_DN3974_c0_g2~~TRINITY_DN3974_c0_g2_i1.p1  ORF type:complete len:351 (+),score=71.00 TRINITY_DN3974_c0_g2_i1:56-1108(+)